MSIYFEIEEDGFYVQLNYDIASCCYGTVRYESLSESNRISLDYGYYFIDNVLLKMEYQKYLNNNQYSYNGELVYSF